MAQGRRESLGWIEADCLLGMVSNKHVVRTRPTVRSATAHVRDCESALERRPCDRPWISYAYFHRDHGQEDINMREIQETEMLDREQASTISCNPYI